MARGGRNCKMESGSFVMLRKMNFIFYSARHMRENYFILNDYEEDDDVAGWRDRELKLRQVHQMAAHFQLATCSMLHLHSHSHLVATMPSTEPELGRSQSWSWSWSSSPRLKPLCWQNSWKRGRCSFCCLSHCCCCWWCCCLCCWLLLCMSLTLWVLKCCGLLRLGSGTSSR